MLRVKGGVLCPPHSTPVQEPLILNVNTSYILHVTLTDAHSLVQFSVEPGIKLQQIIKSR